MARACAGLALLLGACAMTPEAADWIWLQNRSFTVICDGSDAECRALALDFERFRAAAHWYAQVRGSASPPRATILAFPDPVKLKNVVLREDFDRFATATSDGLLLVAVLAKRTDLETETLRAAYMRWSLDANRMRAPDWYLAGMAELVASAKWEADSVTIGLPPLRFAEAIHASNLRTIGEFPVEALVAGKPLGDRQAAAPAASWLLLHYLTFGSKERAKLVPAYLSAWLKGKSSLDAFRQAFASDPELLWKGEAIPYAAADRFPALRSRQLPPADEAFEVRAATREEAKQALDRLRAIANRAQLAG
jgi:hypothetical protein